MKYKGTLNGIPIYSSPDCPPDQIFILNDKSFYFDYPLRKDGKPDMRYRINKFHFKTLKIQKP